MKAVRIEQAIGHRLACDVTGVTPTAVRSVVTKGTVIEEEHLSALRDAGHVLIYIDESDESVPTQDLVDEGPASLAIAQSLSGSHLLSKGVDAGKTFLFANADGLLRVDPDICRYVNDSDIALLITKPPFSVVRMHELVAVVDLIPLTVSASRLSAMIEQIGTMGAAVDVAPFAPAAVSLLITGTEVYEGRIPDAVAPVVEDKVARYGGKLQAVQFVPDDEDRIASSVKAMAQCHDVVIVTGGMSVDPTDRTPAAIGRVADTIVKYGIPLLPTAMSMVARRGSTTILGISAGLVYYRSANILDRLLPLVFAGEPVTREYLVHMGAGGLMPEFIADVEGKQHRASGGVAG